MWDDVTKHCEVVSFSGEKQLAENIVEHHAELGHGKDQGRHW